MTFREKAHWHGRGQYLARVFDGVFWMKPGLADLMRRCAGVFDRDVLAARAAAHPTEIEAAAREAYP